MSSVDPMIFFSNILLIRQLLCINTYSKEKSTRSGYMYREEKLEHLQDEPEEHLDLRCAHIVECLLLSDCETLLERARMKEYKNLKIFHHELPKAIQFVYEAKKFSLYFSAQQEDNAEPMGGLKFFIDETKIEMMKGILKELDRVYLIVVVRSSLQSLSDVDLSDTMQKFSFITDLYLLNLTHEYTSWDCVSYNTVQNFISLEKVRKLRTLKVKHMLITDVFLEKMGSMALESLSFAECVFLTFKDTVQQSEEIEVAFGKSYETICFSKCKRYEEYRSSYALGRMRCIAIKINLNKCTKLRNLTVNMDYYTSVMLSDQILGSLRYLSLGKKNCELLLSSSRCYVARLEYFVINTWDLELAVNVLKEINRNELKHLVLICYEMISIHEICDVSDLFNLEFAALEVLEIGAGYRDLGLNSRFTSGIQIKKLETLRINCWCVDKELMQMITKFEMLKHLEIFMFVFADVSYELLWRQLPNLKGPIEKLFVSSKLTVSELVRLIEPLNKLKEFYMDSRSIQSSFDSLTNQNYGIFKSAKIYLSRLEEFVINSRFIWSSFYSLVNRNGDKFQPAKVDANKWNLVESKNVVHLKLHTLHIGMGLAQKELIQLMLCQYFEAFAGIKKLVIDVIPKRPEIIQKLFGSMQKQFNNLIESVFEMFKQLDVLVFCYKSSCISREEADILHKLFSSRCRLLRERCKWSDKCNEEKTIFELHK